MLSECEDLVSASVIMIFDIVSCVTVILAIKRYWQFAKIW